MAVFNDHAGLPVLDVEKAKVLYCDLLGFEEVYRKPMNLPHMKEVVFLRKDDFKIEFLVMKGDSWQEKPSGNIRGMVHLSFLTDDLDAEIERFKKAGLKCTVPVMDSGAEVPGEEECRRAVFFEGPDGEKIELRGK